jgi:hypothetical protein
LDTKTDRLGKITSVRAQAIVTRKTIMRWDISRVQTMSRALNALEIKAKFFLKSEPETKTETKKETYQ